MNKGLILLLSALILFGSLVPASAAEPYISIKQNINFTANKCYFWAMIWDYTHGKRESATPGHVNTDYWLGYSQPNFREVHVAYLYRTTWGRYVEAQALRNVVL